MEISRDDWFNFKNKLKQIDDKAYDEMMKYLKGHGGYENMDRENILRVAYAITNKYGEASSALAANMYDMVAIAFGKTLPPAEVLPPVDFGEIAKAIVGANKTAVDKDKQTSSVVSRFVKRAGADTTLKNALRDGAEFAWIPAGDTCVFCLTLASRGWQRMSKDALKGGHAEHIHPHCDCTYSVRFDKKGGVKGYNPEKYRKMYENAEGNTPQEKINSMRRIQYQENKDKINAQKRANYSAHKMNNLIAAQEEKESKKPLSMVGNYDDYEKLELTEKEVDTLKNLNRLALENQVEYGKILYNEGETDDITSNLHGKVLLPVKQTEGTGLKVFHSHTNETPPSSADLIALTVDKVDRIGIISINGDTWVAEINGGIRPTVEELIEVTQDIYEELENELYEYPEVKDMTPEEKNYMFIREKFFRITRHFKWKVMGGDINEI